LSWISEPLLLFPLLAFFGLLLIWGATFSIIRIKRADAERAAESSTRELLNTYEAQIVRSLREIDQTLKLVNYLHQGASRYASLAELRSHGLLPPDLVFIVSIADSRGTIIDTTHPPATGNVADQDYFRAQTAAGAFFVGRMPTGATGDAKLHFSARLDGPNGSFDGVAIVAVDAAYFVSDYDVAKLGEHGVLGLTGSDGFIRVRRSGDWVSSGDKIDYPWLVRQPPGSVTAGNSPTDGVNRWRSVDEIYGFPLAVVVGLSVDEQLAGARRDTRAYLWRAALASALVLALAYVLVLMGKKLVESRLRAREATLAQARRAEYLAYHDGLTGLPNRGFFSKLLSEGIAAAQSRGGQLGVAFLDLDRFKQINDSLGHGVGDQLLQEVAARLTGAVGEGDTVARLGGDEFMMLWPQLADDQQACAIAQRILDRVAKPFLLLGHDFRVTASIGISIYPRDGLDEHTLAKNADSAMYQAKAEGRNKYQLFSETIQVHSLERVELESSLRRALEHHDFRLLYQAKHDISSGRITGMEALLRWKHPVLGEVAPRRFIPVAAESGLMVPIGKWVLRTACVQNVAWSNMGLPPRNIAVNLTAQQFYDPHLLQDVVSILESTGMDAHLLELEITESLLIQDVERTLRIMTGLKGLGVRIAIDDFGTGFVALASLHQFPLDTIKIDRSLIRDIAGGREDRGLADAIIAMGKSLSLTVVVQGVETREQAELLRRHAFDELQGFYLKRPVPAEEFTQLLLAEASASTYSGRWPELETV
jgi:diguanylate cyclase (GGDEF)-like protein